MTETIQVLEEARRLLAGGWCQDIPDHSDHTLDTAEAFDLRGALLKANKDLCFSTTPFIEAKEECYLTIFGKPSEIWDDDDRDFVYWNDSPGRTQAEVLDVVDRTIARLKEAA